MDVVRDLNEQQRRAAIAGNGPVLIVAGPGTGKTKTLTARIAFLLAQGTQPAEIAALTFTNKAAREMRERLQKLLGKDAVLPKIATFHALGHDLLAQNGVPGTLATPAQQLEIVTALTKPAALKGASVPELLLVISRAKTALAPPADVTTKQVLTDYEGALAAQNLYDFDDLLRQTYDMLREKIELRPDYQHVLVDEFQDTSELQYALLRLFAKTENYFVIGDPNQSIYAFRGATVDTFTRFRADFPQAQAIDLTVNYRSRPEIIGLANAIFPESPQLRPNQSEHGLVQMVQTLNEYSEAELVLRDIQKGIGGSDFLHAHADAPALEPADYAVVYRTHRAARTLQKLLSESGVPYQIVGEGSPYEQPDVQAVIAALRFLHDNTAPLPTYKKLTPTQIKTLLAAIEIDEKIAVCDQANTVATTLGLADNPQLPQFLSMLVQFGTGKTSLAACLNHLDTIAEGEFYDPNVNAVTLLTIHASKGLEFRHVFVIGAEEGILPKTTTRDEGNIDEERRLFYVAVTRAKETLHILHAKTRGGQSAALSRFASELPVEILPHTIDPNLPTLEKRLKKRAAKRAQTSLF